MNEDRHNNFDLLRLILASMVMAGHFVYLTRSTSIHSFLFTYANFAVEAFFVISGYLIYASISNAPAIGPYAVRRVCRIYPLYATMVIIQAITMLWLLPGAVHLYSVNAIKYVVVNLCFANFLSPDIAGLTAGLPEPEFNPSMWTLKVEVGFYVILPLLALAIRRYGICTMVPIFVGSIVYSELLIHENHLQLARQLPGQLQYFIAGIALYHYRSRWQMPTWLVVSLLIALFALVNLEGSIWQILRPVLVGGVVYLFGAKLPAVKIKRDISYGVYLIHGPVIQTGIIANLIAPTYAGLAVVWVVVYGLAILSDYLIEGPAIRLGKRISRSKVFIPITILRNP